MKKLIVLISATFLTVSIFGQNTKNHPGFFSKVSKQKELSVPGINNSFINFHVQNKPVRQLPHLKEADALKQRLDSVVAPGFDKDIYVYDASGNVLRDDYFEWDGSQWVNYWKSDYSYDSNGNRTQVINFDWDGFQWVNSYKDEYSYDSNGNQTKYISYEWDSNQWLNSYKNESFYDGENNLTQNISSWGSGSPDNIWIAASKNDYEYDLSGNKTQDISYSWNNDLWENASKTEFIFDASSKNTQIFVFAWDGENWLNSEKYEIVYDSNENITGYVFSEWDNIEWVEAAKYVYEYDANGNMTLSNLIYFDGDENITYSKEESVFDDFGNRISYSYFELDFENEEYILAPVWKEEYGYDNSFTYDDLILPFTPGDFESYSEFDVVMVLQMDINLIFKHKLTHITYLEGEGDSWMMTGDYTVYYSYQNVTGVDELKLANNVSVYPNPATNQVIFNIDAAVNQFTVDLYDIQGKLVMRKVSENNRPFSIESLNEGLYFYRLSENQNFYTGKLMVK